MIIKPNQDLFEHLTPRQYNAFQTGDIMSIIKLLSQFAFSDSGEPLSQPAAYELLLDMEIKTDIKALVEQMAGAMKDTAVTPMSAAA